ncbi:MATE family efflux transporter [bacterium]|nr:MATE family efflux transporter [bacterium]
MGAAQRDFNEKSTLSNVLYMGVPSMVGFVATNLYGLIDIFWVGQLGSAHVAAVTLFQAFAFVLSSTNMLVGSGSVAIISRRFGEKDYPATRDAIKQTFILKLILAITIAASSIFFVDKMLYLMHAAPDVVELGITYGQCHLLALPILFVSFTMFTALRGIGQAPRAMHIMMLITVLNVVLDPLLIFDRLPRTLSIAGIEMLAAGTKVGLGLGIKGAVIARAISVFIGLMVGLFILRFGRNDINFSLLSGWKPDFRLMKGIIKIGFPVGLTNVVRTSMNAATASFVGMFGTIIVASYGFASRILQITTFIGVGMSLGTAAIVGIYLGSENAHRASDAVKKSAFIVLGIVGAMGAFIHVFAVQIMTVFTSEASIIAEGATALRILLIGQIMISVRMVVASSFMGSGNTWPPLVISATCQSLRVMGIAFLVYVLGADQTSIWWAFTSAMTLECLATIFWFRKGKWKKQQV